MSILPKHASIGTTLHPWLWPTQPWKRIHIDYAGPVDGRMMLYSHCGRPLQMARGHANVLYYLSTIHALRQLFATYGLPQQLVSDMALNFLLVILLLS